MPAPYDSLETVITAARVRLNDAIAAIGGEVVTDTNDFTLVMINNAWRRLQDLLAHSGFAALDREVALSLAASGSADQGSRVSIDWTTTPALPQDLIFPLDLSERAQGSTANYIPMDQCFWGLPTAPKTALNRLWEWRQEKIFVPGATAATQILMRYAGYLSDFVANSTTAFALQPVPLMRCLNAFAWLICSEAARGRGDLDAGWFDGQASLGAEMIFSRDFRQGKALYKRSELGKQPDSNSRDNGPAGPRVGQKAQ